MIISHSYRWSVLSGTSRQPLVKLLFHLWIQALHVGITLYFDLNTRFKLCAILGNKYPPAKTSITLSRKSLSKLSPKGNACNLIWIKFSYCIFPKKKEFLHTASVWHPCCTCVTQQLAWGLQHCCCNVDIQIIRYQSKAVQRPAF